MYKQERYTNQIYQKEIEEYMKVVQNQIESSFNNIDAYLDSLLNETSDCLNVQYQTFLQSSSSAYFINIPQIQIDNSNFISQLYQGISPLINTQINNQVLLKEQSLNLLQKEHIQQDQKNMNQDIQSVNTVMNIPQLSTNQSTNESNVKPFNYQLMQECSISQSGECCAIAIDKECSTLVAGCESLIKVFQFKQGIIKQIQTLNEHKGDVRTLNFMKKSKQFISGSQDKSIIIWKCNQNNQWSSQSILNGHNGWVQCLVINTNEDLIISGSNDTTIKFWINKNQWLCQQSITDHSNCIEGLSLNQQQNRVVSCGSDNQILIIEQTGYNAIWKVIQKITVEQYGWRVCFIDNNMFTFSPESKKWISVFEMNPINKQFSKTRDIHVNSGYDGYPRFPQQYINKKCMILSKNGQYVNLIRKKQNGEFITEQSIHFGTHCLYGGMSDDGEYLITWDYQSKQIQIRRYKE